MFERTSTLDYYLCYVGALLALWALIAGLAGHGSRIEPAPPIRPNTHACRITDGATGRSLQILTYSRVQAAMLVDRLCRADAVRLAYEEVYVTWHRRRIDEYRLAFDQQFDLLISRPGPMELQTSRIANAYVPLARYASNTSRFISLNDMPEVSLDYFRSRRLGLIETSHSLSGHIVPRLRLRSAGIDESALAIRYYDDHFELYRALISREVDVIATGIQLPAEDVTAANRFILPIQGGLAGPTWYLHPRLTDTPIHCLITAALIDFAKESAFAYERSLQVLRECER
jgi:hypothetical protein